MHTLLLAHVNLGDLAVPHRLPATEPWVFPDKTNVRLAGLYGTCRSTGSGQSDAFGQFAEQGATALRLACSNLSPRNDPKAFSVIRNACSWPSQLPSANSGTLHP